MRLPAGGILGGEGVQGGGGGPRQEYLLEGETSHVLPTGCCPTCQYLGTGEVMEAIWGHRATSRSHGTRHTAFPPFTIFTRMVALMPFPPYLTLIPS